MKPLSRHSHQLSSSSAILLLKHTQYCFIISACLCYHKKLYSLLKVFPQWLFSKYKRLQWLCQMCLAECYGQNRTATVASLTLRFSCDVWMYASVRYSRLKGQWQRAKKHKWPLCYWQVLSWTLLMSAFYILNTDLHMLEFGSKRCVKNMFTQIIIINMLLFNNLIQLI